MLDSLSTESRGRGRGRFQGSEAGEIDAGDLEAVAVEKDGGAAAVEFVEGDGLLDGGAILNERQVEGGASPRALAGVLEGGREVLE